MYNLIFCSVCVIYLLVKNKFSISISVNQITIFQLLFVSEFWHYWHVSPALAVAVMQTALLDSSREHTIQYAL